ncbi:MAG: glycosyltransferase family 39 protein, partial [Anaerolineae bacterium]
NKAKKASGNRKCQPILNHPRDLCLRAFVVVECLFALLGFLYSVITPIYEAPDEVWHDAYVRWVAEGNGLPPLDEDRSGAYQEAAQPPLYYLVAAAVRRFFPDDDLSSLMWHNPFFGYQAGGTVNDNKNMLIHTDRERFPWTGAARAIHVTRLVSLFFGLVAVAGAWLLAREAVGDDRRGALPLRAAALVALTPQFLFISGIVSNDSAAAATSTLSLWAAARALRRGPDLRRALLLGLLVGLAALTKTSALLLLPLALMAVILSPGGTARQKGALALVTLGVALAVGGWWYGCNALLYGDPLGISRHIRTPWGRQTPASLATLLGEMPRLYRSFWGAFGWGHVEYPAWVYIALGGLVVLALVGWGQALLPRPLPASPRPLLLAAVWSGAVFLALLQWMRQVEAPHGRLLFPAIGAWALLVAVGWEMLPLPRAGKDIGLLGALALLNLLTPVLIIRPAFAPPRLLDPAAAARTVSGPQWTYGETIRLLGAAPDRPSVAPGEVLTVRACWTALAPVEKDYTVVVQLVGREETRIGERHTYPGLGRFPTSLWPVGRAFCDDYRVRVESWAPGPELYDGLIGLYDRDPSAGLPVLGEDGRAAEMPVAFRVRVAPQRPLAVTPTYPLDYRLGEAVRLVGYDLAGGVEAGGLLTVTLYWRADGVPGGDYRVFVHLLNARGELVTQHDGPPRWGRYPTWAWRQGDVVPDEHVLSVPVSAVGGPFSLAVGMYRPDTLERLPVIGPAGSVPEGRILLDIR